MTDRSRSAGHGGCGPPCSSLPSSSPALQRQVKVPTRPRAWLPRVPASPQASCLASAGQPPLLTCSLCSLCPSHTDLQQASGRPPLLLRALAVLLPPPGMLSLPPLPFHLLLSCCKLKGHILRDTLKTPKTRYSFPDAHSHGSQNLFSISFTIAYNY